MRADFRLQSIGECDKSIPRYSEENTGKEYLTKILVWTAFQKRIDMLNTMKLLYSPLDSSYVHKNVEHRLGNILISYAEYITNKQFFS